MARSLCAGGMWGGCGRVFSDARAFDRHRTGDFGGTAGTSSRRCMTEAEMLAAGLVMHPTKTDPRGPIWALEVSLHVGERLRGTGGKRRSA